MDAQRPSFRDLVAGAGEDWVSRKLGLFPDANGIPSDFEVCVRRRGGGALVVAQPLLGDLQVLNRELLTLNEELLGARRQVARHRDALDVQNARLLELDRIAEVERIRTNFLITVSHELRTPLASVYGAALTIARSNLDLDRTQRQPLLDMLVEQIEALNKITETILLASEIESDEAVLSTIPVDPLELAIEVAEPFQGRREDLELVVAAAGERPAPLLTDRGKLAHILTTLLDNAFRFSPDGGRIAVAVADIPEGVVFRIEDTGLGIPVEARERIFEKFARVDADMSRGIGGAGLGLYISRRLAEQLGGRLHLVRSREGEGSTFSLELPRAPTAPE